MKLIASFAFVLLTATEAATAATVPASVADYLAQGFQIAAKTEEKRVLPGTAPYENRDRWVLVTIYDLRRGEERVTCTLVYDSQRDSFATECQ